MAKIIPKNKAICGDLGTQMTTQPCTLETSKKHALWMISAARNKTNDQSISKIFNLTGGGDLPWRKRQCDVPTPTTGPR